MKEIIEDSKNGNISCKKLYLEIGQRLLLRRKELNLTQEKVAELLKMSSAYYGKIERGEKGPSLEKLLLINQKLELDLNYLLTGQVKGEMFQDPILISCPNTKRYDFEQLIKYALKLAIKE